MRAPVIGHRISRRTRCQERIDGWLEAIGKNGRIVVDVAATTFALRTLALYHERARINMRPVFGPWVASAVGSPGLATVRIRCQRSGPLASRPRNSVSRKSC